MIKKISPLEKMLFTCIAFNMLLLCIRIVYTSDLMYGFYIWNTFLATVPLFFSRQLKKIKSLNFKACALMCCWLLFFPNAPYLVTDIFHVEQRPLVPYWFDLLIVTSAAWNGVVLGIASLMHVEKFLSRHFKTRSALAIIFTSFLLGSYGVYLGRYLRYNSWDVVSHPATIIKTTSSHFIYPTEHLQTWAFTFSFAILLCIIYFTVKKLPELFQADTMQNN